MHNAVNLRSKSASEHPLLGLVPTQSLECIGRTLRVFGGHEPLRSDRGCHVDELTAFAESSPAGFCGFPVSKTLLGKHYPATNSLRRFGGSKRNQLQAFWGTPSDPPAESCGNRMSGFGWRHQDAVSCTTEGRGRYGMRGGIGLALAAITVFTVDVFAQKDSKTAAISVSSECFGYWQKTMSDGNDDVSYSAQFCQ